MVWGEDGIMRADLNGDLDVKLYYPNSYIFCASIIEDGEEANPKDVAEDYDSHYEINLKDINNFINVITRTLASQISLLNLKIEGEFENLPLALTRPPQVKCIHRPVEYVFEKEIHLNEADDFIKNRFTQIYIDSIFKKHESYKNDKEYRFVFFIDQPLLGLVSVKEEPILLNIKPIASFVSSKK